MALMTPQEYVESLRKLNTRVYMFGEKIDNWVDHPMIRPSINCVAMTYALAQDPQYADLMTVKSSLTGHTINRFTHLHQSTEDLINKVKMQRLLGQKTASCFQRCVGMDAFNAVFSTTYEIDEKYGTHYHENFKKFLTFVQDNDLTVDGAMTDPKGDRSKAPSQQADPDMYVHVVERARTASWSAVPSATRPAPSTPTGTSSCPPSPWVRRTRTGQFPSPAPPTPRACT